MLAMEDSSYGRRSVAWPLRFRIVNSMPQTNRPAEDRLLSVSRDPRQPREPSASQGLNMSSRG